MGIKRKTVFISYRRTNFYTALAVYQDLTKNGYDVFFDYESIDSGDFEAIIFENIRYRAHFVIILSPSALERLGEKNSVMRREVELAIDEKRNIIPLMMGSFDFGSPSAKEALTGKLSSLSSYNGLKLVPEYIFAGMEKLRRFLDVELEAVRQPALSVTAEEDTEKRQVRASEEPTIQEESLTAEEWFERGYKNQKDGNHEESIRCYEKALEISPDISAAYSNFGVAFSDLKRYAEAEEAYRKAIKLNPEYAKAYSNLGSLLKATERYEEAEEAYRKAIELNPEYAKAYSNLGLLLHEKLNRREEAEEAYRKAIKLNPEEATAYSDLGILLKATERYEEAEEAYQKSIELNPEYAKAYSNLGLLLHEKLNRREEAEKNYRKAIEINPEYAIAHHNLGNLLRDLNRREEAEKGYRKAIEINPRLAKPYNNLGILLKATERYEEAEEAYQKAIELNPEYAIAYSNLGNLLSGEKLQCYEEAEEAYRKAIEFNPESATAYSKLGSLLYILKRDVEGKEIYRKSIELNPDDKYNHACFESLCGNIDEALALLKVAIEDKGADKGWAKEDPDLENLRDDPRFWEIVGEEGSDQ